MAGALSRSITALIRCDASPEIGLGHLVRCLSLAEALEKRYGVNPVFAMRLDPLADRVMAKRYRTISVPRDESQGTWLAEKVRQYDAQLLVVDVRDDLTRPELQAIRSDGIRVAVIDDLSDRRLAADFVFYPPVPQVRQADWSEFTGEIFSGWQWVILRSDLAQPTPKGPAGHANLLVTMGGSDPAGLTLQAVRALELPDLEFTATVMLGPGFAHDDALSHLLTRTRRRFVVRRGLSDMPSVMARADLALCSFGVTAYELAATGIPAIYLCLTADHAESASALVEAGMGVSVGVFETVTDSQLAATARELLQDRHRRKHMRQHARRCIDGLGAARVASTLGKHLSWPSRIRGGEERLVLG
jgi:spore coat polysaccharide biosynthesis protein SpsF